MQRIAKFEIVSEERFIKDYMENAGLSEGEEAEARARAVYRELKLPKRATGGSAGYDFYAPEDICLKPGESVKFPTGVRVWIDPAWVLLIVPRSSLGFKFKIELSNTVGVIDSDYYGSENEGHMFLKLVNCNYEGKIVKIAKGQACAQGIFVSYGITEDDDCTAPRNGGFGSTDQ